MNDAIWEFIVGVMILAIVFMLVRPGAPAAAAIQDISKALAGLVKTATDYTVSGTSTGNGQTQVT